MKSQRFQHDPERAALLKKSAKTLIRDLKKIDFAAVSDWVYNPLEYAWAPFEEYLDRFVSNSVQILFLGMNPGPWGMAQTGIPFGEVAAVRDWIGIQSQAKKPKREHPKRPIDGLHCPKSEVSGRRLWELFQQEYGTPENFFAAHFVSNYCPLAFMAETAANLTPDKFPAIVRGPLEKACDKHLVAMIEVLKPEWVIGVGAFAEDAAKRVAPALSFAIRTGKILHPSPASPAANRGWNAIARKQLQEIGLW